MNEPKRIDHQRKAIFYMDFTGLRDEEEIKQVILKSIEFIRSHPPNSVLTLTNLQNIHFNKRIKDLFSDFISGEKPYIKASAIGGINGLIRIIYNGVMRITGRTIRSFDNINVAKKDWLISNN